ncbi:MAG: SUMF1/EgtB/PvdO family nonheme iron enzyme [Anaerolineales bacterium]
MKSRNGLILIILVISVPLLIYKNADFISQTFGISLPFTYNNVVSLWIINDSGEDIELMLKKDSPLSFAKRRQIGIFINADEEEYVGIEKNQYLWWLYVLDKETGLYHPVPNPNCNPDYNSELYKIGYKFVLNKNTTFRIEKCDIVGGVNEIIRANKESSVAVISDSSQINLPLILNTQGLSISEEPRIGPITLGAGITEQGSLINPGVSFPEGIKEVCANFQYENMKPDMQFTRTWYRNGEECSELTSAWTISENGKESVCLSTNPEMEESLPSGDYEVKLIVDDTLMQSAKFAIQNSSSAGIGAEKISEKDGMVMVKIIQGDFSPSLPNSTQISEPANERWVDKTPVTNEMFANFLNEKGNRIEKGTYWYDTSSSYAKIENIGGTWKPKAGFNNNPVVEVTWFGAWQYCKWAGRSLSYFGPDSYNEDLFTVNPNLSEWGGSTYPDDSNQTRNAPILGPREFETKMTNSFNDVGFRCYLDVMLN